jgi:ABC-type transport system involved in multi-copper enzyme maturation permease subunit
VNGTLAVARYTLIELARRRILLVFMLIGVVGIAIIGGGMKIISVVSPDSVASFREPHGSPPPDPAIVSRIVELTFVNQLTAVVGFFALLIAFAIGMTAIYHDLDSGAGVGIFSKPVSRLAFTVGKLLAALVAMIVVVGSLSLETRLVMILFGGGLEEALLVETVAAVANAVLLMLIVLALSTWMNNIVAAVVAFIYNSVAVVIVSIHTQLIAGQLGNNGILNTGLQLLYWLVPHHLMSDAQRQLVQADYDVLSSHEGGTPLAQMVASVPGPSDIQDVMWWAFLVFVMATLVYIAVRGRQV